MKHLDQKIVNYEFYKENLENNYYIYVHCTLDEDIPFYIGKGKKNRCKHHSDRSDWWKRIVAKHDYYIKILEINLTQEVALSKEKEYILKFGRRQFKNGGTLVNLTDGGDGVSGKIFTDEEREALSKKFKENPELWSSGKRGEYFGVSIFGTDNQNYVNRGELNPLSKKVVKLSLKGEFIEMYNSVLEAAVDNNTSGSAVSCSCLNKRHQLKGYVYRFLDDYEKGNLNITKGKTSKKMINKLDLHTNEILQTFNSASETKNFGFNPTNVSQVCRGVKKTHKGFKWQFAE